MKTLLKGNTCSKAEAYKILHEYIQDQLDLLERKELSEDSFSIPNWPNLQAYLCGFKKALKKVKEFLPDQGES